MGLILCQYQGGGYDGCYWEWNFFYFDADGKFHDLMSSGQAGCQTEEQARELLAEEKNSTYFYDLSVDAGWRELNKETHPGLVMGIFRYFEDENDPDIVPFAVCSVCGEDTCEPIYDSQYGPDGIVCPGCWRTCDCCEYYFEELSEYEGEWLCPYCIEYKEDEKLQEKQRRMLQSSLLTGKPDIFSRKMRWNCYQFNESTGLGEPCYQCPKQQEWWRNHKEQNNVRR